MWALWALVEGALRGLHLFLSGFSLPSGLCLWSQSQLIFFDSCLGWGIWLPLMNFWSVDIRKQKSFPMSDSVQLDQGKLCLQVFLWVQSSFLSSEALDINCVTFTYRCPFQQKYLWILISNSLSMWLLKKQCIINTFFWITHIPLTQVWLPFSVPLYYYF